MHKIDSPNATGANEFTDGDPATAVDATEVWSKWLNAIQRELIAILTAASITPSDADDDQVIEAIQALLAAHADLTAPHSATSAATASRLALRDAAGRCKFAEGASGGDAVVLSQFANLMSANGYQQLPGGLIIQWGKFVVTVTGMSTWANASVVFPIAFPNACFAIMSNVASTVVGGSIPGGSTGLDGVSIDSISATGFRQWAWDTSQTGNNDICYIAIGW